MIKDEILEERLNAFKSGEELPQPENSDNEYNLIEDRISILTRIVFEITNLSYTFLKSAAYGYAIKTVFATDWSFWPIIAVGFSINLVLETFTNTFKK